MTLMSVVVFLVFGPLIALWWIAFFGMAKCMWDFIFDK